MGTYLFFLFSSSKLRCVAAIHIVLALLVDPIINYELKKYFYSTFFLITSDNPLSSGTFA